MLTVEYRLDQEAFRVAIVTTKRQHFADDPASGLSFDMHDRVFTDNDEFWQRFELAVGEKVAEEKKSMFFHCAC